MAATAEAGGSESANCYSISTHAMLQHQIATRLQSEEVGGKLIRHLNAEHPKGVDVGHDAMPLPESEQTSVLGVGLCLCYARRTGRRSGRKVRQR